MIYIKGVFGIFATWITLNLCVPPPTQSKNIIELEKDIIIQKAILESYKTK